MSDRPLPISTGFVEVDGSRLQYEVAGQGHPLVLFQGRNFFDRRIWENQFQAFAQHYRVIRYDLRGFGQSPGSTKPYTLVEDLAQIVRTLTQEKTFLLDLGGGVALDFAHTYPSLVDALVLVSPAIPPLQSFEEAQINLPKHLERVAPIVEAIRQNDWQSAIDSAIQYLQLPSSANYAWVRQILAETLPSLFSSPSLPPTLDRRAFDTRHQWIKEIRVPTLLLVGANAPSEVQLSTSILEKSMPAVQKREITSSHVLLSVEQPEQFYRAVRDFLDTIQ
ncbi:MAG: alpha/beta hydrolase [Ktedonobacteraceae bacterium]|nr:alpha/beta hydrolase [Ktedonobacteraceae bacterium]